MALVHRYKDAFPPEITNLILEYFTREEAWCFNKYYPHPTLYMLSRRGNVILPFRSKVIEYIVQVQWPEALEAIPTWNEEDLNNCLQYAAGEGCLPVMKWLIQRGASDRNIALVKAANRGQIHVMEYLAVKGAVSFNDALCLAAVGGQIPTLQWLDRRGVSDWDRALRCSLGDYIVGKGEVRSTYVQRHLRHRRLAQDPTVIWLKQRLALYYAQCKVQGIPERIDDHRFNWVVP